MAGGDSCGQHAAGSGSDITKRRILLVWRGPKTEPGNHRFGLRCRSTRPRPFPDDPGAFSLRLRVLEGTDTGGSVDYWQRRKGIGCGPSRPARRYSRLQRPEANDEKSLQTNPSPGGEEGFV